MTKSPTEGVEVVPLPVEQCDRDAVYVGPVEVLVTRPDTGEVLERKTISNDFFLICNGNRYVKSHQIWGQTVQVNIAMREPGQ